MEDKVSQPLDKFGEDNIRSKLYDHFCEIFANDLVVEKWRGWSTKVGRERKERHHFLREFDIAIFSRGKREYILRRPIMEILKPPYYLTLVGIEIKGLTKERQKVRYPGFAEGIDQALVLLHQGADFSYLVKPEEKQDDELKIMCGNFGLHVGLIAVRQDWTFDVYREPSRNYKTSDEKKGKMLTSLIHGGYFTNIRLPKWCKEHEY